MKRVLALLSLSLVLATTAFAQGSPAKSSTDCCTTCCEGKCDQPCCDGVCTPDCCDSGCTEACCQK
jgi:hypothetical protein